LQAGDRRARGVCWRGSRCRPRERTEAEVEDAVEFVEGETEVESGFGGGEAAAAGFLHDRQAVEVEPADGGGVDGADGAGFGGLESGAKGGDAVFEELEVGAGEGGFDDFGAAPEEEWAVGAEGFAQD
jgi:hypothetical protein